MLHFSPKGSWHWDDHLGRKLITYGSRASMQLPKAALKLMQDM